MFNELHLRLSRRVRAVGARQHTAFGTESHCMLMLGIGRPAFTIMVESEYKEETFAETFR